MLYTGMVSSARIQLEFSTNSVRIQFDGVDDMSLKTPVGNSDSDSNFRFKFQNHFDSVGSIPMFQKPAISVHYFHPLFQIQYFAHHVVEYPTMELLESL